MTLVDIHWLFVIIKSYVKVNFKERNNNNNTHNLKTFRLLSFHTCLFIFQLHNVYV